MEELSLHILDIAQNSISADATKVLISISENTAEDYLDITIEDNGRGMDKSLIEKVCDPFVTKRKERKVGLGIPLFKQAAEMTGGYFKIESELGKGTKVFARFIHSSIDRAPLGDMAGTVVTLISGYPELDLVYKHTFNDKTFTFTTKEIREILKDVPINSAEVTLWIKDYLTESINKILK